MSAEKQIILIIDDEPLKRKLLRAHLSGNGYTVWEAAGGSEALERAKDKPDLILLDIMMPDMDGFEVCRRLKENEDTRGIPVIYLSAMKDTRSIVHGLALGGVDYVSIPYDGPELLARVKAHITLRRQEEQLSRYARQLEQMVEERTQQLIHADRLASIGTFAAAIVHEVNGPLTYIGGNAELLKLFWSEMGPLADRYLNTDGIGSPANKIPKISGYIEAILEGQKRIAQIVGTLKTYARKDEGGVEPCFLVEPATDAVRLVQHRCKHGVSIDIRIPPDLRILCNRRKISQVFINLFTNAIDAMPDQRGEICVEAVPSNGCVDIKVKDSGGGIPDTMSETIFDPFFTTKGEEQGTGLGLYIVRNIVEEHGGKVRLAPSDGTGATFHISMPPLHRDFDGGKNNVQSSDK
jgi:signal transduction histidine kinase